MVPNVVQTTQFIARITLVIVSVATVIITALCLLMGMEPTRAFLNALWVSTSGFVTGGFTPMQLSIMYYHSFPFEAIPHGAHDFGLHQLCHSRRGVEGASAPVFPRHRDEDDGAFG